MNREKVLSFYCKACRLGFKAEPARIVPTPDRPWQLDDYFANCRECGGEAPQAHWELALAQAHASATGPRTPAGKAASAANLKGHPTPEETRRTRFNAMKTGIFAKTATFWPARPGQYPECTSCEHFNNGCDEYGATKRNPPACLKKIENMMQFQIAFETRDPKMLMANNAMLQAGLWDILNRMVMTVLRDGPDIRTPQWHADKEGGIHAVALVNPAGETEQIYEIAAHPLLRWIIEFTSRNGMALPDSGMTLKAKEDQETLSGFLAKDSDDQETALEFKERQTRALEGLADLVRRSQERKARDPVLLEHEALEKGDGG